MKFEIISIFPQIFKNYFDQSILAKAQAKKIIEINIHNLRDFTKDKHKRVDDTPYGGGAGMVLQIEPIFRAVKYLKEEAFTNKKTRIILFSARGKKFNQKEAERLSQYEKLILICGRYEGVDERVAKNIADEEISIGEYVLTGGELPAMVLVDSISRLVPGVLGNSDSLKEESFNKLEIADYKIKSNLEYPQYTKPEVFNNWKVPKILLSGDHKKIQAWREEKRS